MQRFNRLFIMLVIFLSGAVLIPYISLPAQAFGWQLFAGAYEPEPTLAINHDICQPGGYFKLTASGFPASAEAIITLNSTQLNPPPTITTDASGVFDFEINTAGAGEGTYFVTATVSGVSDTVSFKLGGSAPCPSEGASTTLPIPAGTTPFTETIYLPLIFR